MQNYMEKDMELIKSIAFLNGISVHIKEDSGSYLAPVTM